MESEKVKEIKKALACHKQNEIEDTCEYCSNCPASDWDYEKECNIDLFQKTITLINELENENERLTEERGLYKNQFNELEPRFFDLREENKELKDRIAELEKEKGELKQHITEVEKGIINIARERNKKEELASKFIDSYNDSLKQFAERLKEKIKAIAEYYNDEVFDYSYNGITEKDIDKILEEFLK